MKKLLYGAGFFLLLIFSPANLSAQTAKQPAAITVVGKLERVAGIGGESTGWAIALDSEMQVHGEQVRSIEVSGNGSEFAKLEDKHVKAIGKIAIRHGVTRGDWPVLEITSVRESR